MSDTTLPADTHLGRVALRVGDLRRMEAFYTDVVGLEVLDRRGVDDTGSTTESVALGVDDEAVVDLVAGTDAPPRQPAEAGLFHAAIRFPTRGALGAALERVRSEWHLDGASDHGVSEALYLDDPEGNGVELYRDRPRGQWPRDGDRIAFTTDPLDLESIAGAAERDGPDAGSGAPPGTDLGHVHLEVSDLAATRAFYVDRLDFDVMASLPAALFVAAGGYHHHLGANTWNGRSAPAGDGRGLDWFEVVVPDRSAVVAVRDRLRDAGVDAPAAPDRTGADDAFVLHDPDGIELRVRAEC